MDLFMKGVFKFYGNTFGKYNYWTNLHSKQIKK